MAQAPPPDPTPVVNVAPEKGNGKDDVSAALLALPIDAAPAVTQSGVDDLVARAAQGNRAAFQTLFQRHRSDVARLVARMLSGSADIEDVVQEVFFQVFRSLKDFRGQSKFTTWLHRVTVNVVLMHRRSARSRPVLTEELPADTSGDERRPLPDEDAERHSRVRAFGNLVQRLAEKKRVVFILHDLEGVTPQEIAKVVEAPVLTVRTRLFYARRELEEMMQSDPILRTLGVSFSRGEEEDK